MGLIENGNNYAKELNFKCPNFEDMRSCIDCKIKRTGTYNYETRSYTYIGTCKEWEKKEWRGACGCGGHYECVCGFKEWFCFPFDRTNCPFCDKPVKTILSKMIKPSMKIGILGADGFLGQALCKQFPDAVQITRKNYMSLVGTEFDVFINANGNSKKYWAEKAPLEDFKLSVVSVMRTFEAFKIKKYIYISSISARDAYGDTVYGFHKRLAEQIVEKYAESYLILRCCAIIGKGMKKGVVKDLIDGTPLWIEEDTYMRFITVSGVANIVKTMIEVNPSNSIIEVGGVDIISIKEIAEMLGVKYTIRPDVSVVKESDIHDYIKYYVPETKTSKQYIQEFINERMEQPV